MTNHKLKFNGTEPFEAEFLNQDRIKRCAVTSGFGAPIGGLGSGYSVLGKYGFLRENFDSAPDNYRELYPFHPEEYWQYDDNSAFGADYNFVIKEAEESFILSETVPEKFKEDSLLPVTKVNVEACLPESYYNYVGIPELDCRLTAFSPLIFGDIEESAIPAQVFDFTLQNLSSKDRQITLKLMHKVVLFERDSNIGIPIDGHGETAFYSSHGRFTSSGPEVELLIKANSNCDARFIIAWHYPYFKTPSQAATQIYRRKYTTRFQDVIEVVKYAESHADQWRSRINEQHDNIDFPGVFTRLWFGSLSSLITSSMLGSEGEYFEIEVPHSWVNTMDVSAYSSWCVMLLYPELEKTDMQQYVKAIPKTGETRGFVWHSLWNDACDYAEESTFITRYCRDFFYYRDLENGLKDWALLTTIISEKLKNCDENGLIYSSHGNQSYDAWKMPGISIYVNLAWIYALSSYSLMAGVLKKSDEIKGVSCRLLTKKAADALYALLWNSQNNCFNCFSSREECENEPNCIFLDQLFGYWMLGIIQNSTSVFPTSVLKTVANTLYTNNILIKPNHFRGWVNGMNPNGQPTSSNYHANSCWYGPQINLGSIFTLLGDEEKALDIWASVEWSVRNYHMAVGEWNQTCSGEHQAILSTAYPSKDTPRFPSYPRYKSCWEELIRLAGVTLDFEKLYVSPVKMLDFSLKKWTFGGIKCSISVRKNWSKCYLNGSFVAGATIVIARDSKDFQVLEFS